MYRRLFQYLKPLKFRLISLFIIAGLLAIITLGEPATMGLLTDAIFSKTYGISTDAYLRKAKVAKEEEAAWITRINGQPFEAQDKRLLLKAFQQDEVHISSVTISKGIAKIRYELKDIDNDVVLKSAQLAMADVGKPIQVAKVLKREQKPKNRILPNIPTVFIIPFVLVLLQVCRSLLNYGQALLASSIGQKVIMGLRNQVFEHMQRLSVSYFEHKRTGHLMSRVTNDIGILQNLFSNVMVDIVVEPLIIIAGTIYAASLNWKLALIFVAVLPLLVLPIRRITSMLRKVGKDIQLKAAETSAILQESLSSIRVVKAFAMEEYEINRFKNQTRANYKASMKGARLQGLLSQIVEMLAVIGLAVFVWYGGKAVFSRTMSAGELIKFIFVIGYISNPVRKLSKLSGQVQHALAAAERTFSLLDEVPDVREAENPLQLPKLRGGVRFENVSFSYQDGPEVLRNVDFEVRPGEVIALVGPSGAGKTTLVNLLPRFYDPTVGQVLVDGFNLREVDLKSLRGQMGIVPQETVLFRGSIAENIAYGKMDATHDEIVNAAIAANAHDFISSLLEGYDTIVGERGATLSGGQRQRVAIARAILRDPRILILDEATSALDTASEHLVQEALERLMQNRTTFVIAHRLSTIRRADRIMVMESGHVIESGTHDELLALNGLYRSLYEKQFESKEAPDGTDEMA